MFQSTSRAQSLIYNEIRVLARRKFNIISDHVSTALLDEQISDVEFHLILDEVRKYH